MRKPETYYCNGCGGVRGPANHWTLVNNEGSPRFLPWSDADAKDERFGHCCGRNCASKLVDQWFQSRNEPGSEDL